MLSFLRKEQQSGKVGSPPRNTSSPKRKPLASQESVDDFGLPKPRKSSKMSEPLSGNNLLSKISSGISSYCPSPGIRMKKNKKFGSRNDLKEEVSWRASSPTVSRKGLVTKRSSRPTTPITSYSKKKALTKEDYKELIAMHSRKLTESDSAPTLTFVDLTEEDVPSFKKAMTPTPAQKVSTRLKIMEEKELRLPAVKKETTSSQGFDILLTQEQLFNTIQEREIGEEVAQLEKELEKIRLKKSQTSAARRKKEEAQLDAIFVKYLDRNSYLPVIPELSEEDLALVDSIYARGKDRVIAEIAGEECKKTDLMTLRGTQWLNDLVINCYFNLMMQRADADKTLPKIFCFKTFFYPKVKASGHKGVKRWTKKVDIFAMDRLLFPIHLGVHWTIAAALMKEKKSYLLGFDGRSKL